jgi:hypothetical protein
MALARRALLVTLVLLSLAPARSAAATYDVWACTLPNGQPAPTRGWTTDFGGGNATAVDWCSSSDKAFAALRAEIFAATGAGAHAGWAFRAPPESLIAGYTLWRWARTSQSGDAYLDYYLNEDLPRTTSSPFLIEWCGAYLHCAGLGSGSGSHFQAANRVERSGLQVRSIFASLMCDVGTPGHRCEGSFDGARVWIYSARVGLTDFDLPRFTTPPSGSLLSPAAPLEGTKTISLDASDRGGGVERVGIVVDGRTALSQPPDPHAASCRRPFTTPRPCPSATSNTVVFDTATIPNGRHTVQASVIDAAGNQTLSAPVTVTTLNGSQPNGRGASRFVRLNAWLRSKRDKPRRAAVVPYGATRFAEGRLTDAGGHPISGAVLQASSRVRRPGAKYVNTGTVTTSEDGRFAYRIAKGPSRTIRFAYKAYTLDPAPVQTATLSLGVKAGIKLKLSPRRVTNGQKVSFKGKLKGGPARKGTRVTIDVLVPDARRRVPIGNVKADAKGRFKFAYRFRRTLVKARYRFQARLTPQPGYPYRGATSRRVSVVVSP